MIHIITDSAADFEPHELEKLAVICIPMQVAFGEESFKENVNLTKEQFYNKLRENKIFPKTSQPSPYDFELAIKDYLKNGDECVVITISSALSGTYQSAYLTKENLEYDNCYIVDSLSATGGQRLLTEHAVKLRDEGKNAKEIYETLETLKKNVTIFAVIDTLEYLHKGGRLSKTAYTIGSFANIKPIICISKEGKVEVISKTISMKKGIANVCKKVEEIRPDTSYPMYIVYSNKKANGEKLRKAMESIGYFIPQENLINIGATIGTHVGSDACGVVYVAI